MDKVEPPVLTAHGWLPASFTLPLAPEFAKCRVILAFDDVREMPVPYKQWPKSIDRWCVVWTPDGGSGTMKSRAFGVGLYGETWVERTTGLTWNGLYNLIEQDYEAASYLDLRPLIKSGTSHVRVIAEREPVRNRLNPQWVRKYQQG